MKDEQFFHKILSTCNVIQLFPAPTDFEGSTIRICYSRIFAILNKEKTTDVTAIEDEEGLKSVDRPVQP